MASETEAAILQQLVKVRMPFGKYKNHLLCDLPVHYLEWFQRKGFPSGKLGTYLNLLHTIKTNGLDHLLDELKSLDR